MEDIFIPISLFGTIWGIVYLFVRQKERMTLIERGLNANYFENGCERLQQLKWGMVLIGVALGILIGNILSAYTRIEEWVAYFSMTFILGGIALIASYYVGKQFPQNNTPREGM
jgi:purine-cytosine permease-like protein